MISEVLSLSYGDEEMDTSMIAYQLAKIVDQLERLNELLIPLEHLCDCDVELMEVVDEC